MPASDHDMILATQKDVEYIPVRIDELHSGRAGVCVKHAEQLKGLWASIGRLWWAWGLLFAAIGMKWIVG